LKNPPASGVASPDPPQVIHNIYVVPPLYVRSRIASATITRPGLPITLSCEVVRMVTQITTGRDGFIEIPLFKVMIMSILFQCYQLQ